jgi:hypothetical protein
MDANVAPSVSQPRAFTQLARDARYCCLIVGVVLCLPGCAEKKTAAPRATREAPPAVSAAVATPRARPVLDNPYAQIPPQCYVKTRRADGSVNNTCASCHRASLEPNFVDDADLQLEYALPTPALRNPYTNLLGDSARALAKAPEHDVLAYVRSGNYHGPVAPAPGNIAGGNTELGVGRGYAPDAHFHFDERGFDRDVNGGPTGWRAFAYEALPGGFGPELGSFSDVLIRLPPAFRENDEGVYDEQTYAVNLAIVEALIRREDVRIDPVDERRHGLDLNNDGTLAGASHVRFRFDHRASDNLRYVGRAALEGVASQPPVPGLYPRGTEFLHSLRYLDVTPQGVVPAVRMKELRYAKKTRYLSYAELRNEASHEAKEREQRPDRPRQLLGDELRGVSNGQGWIYQGFIEDARGELRVQSMEEHLTCVGCHGGVGATTDSSFALPRKIAGKAAHSGWLHQLSRARAALPGSPTLPSRARALELDEHYWSIVKAQSFGRGRGPVTARADELWGEVPPRELTGVTSPE